MNLHSTKETDYDLRCLDNFHSTAWTACWGSQMPYAMCCCHHSWAAVAQQQHNVACSRCKLGHYLSLNCHMISLLKATRDKHSSAPPRKEVEGITTGEMPFTRGATAATWRIGAVRDTKQPAESLLPSIAAMAAASECSGKRDAPLTRRPPACKV
jgi:hypothetical protein